MVRAILLTIACLVSVWGFGCGDDDDGPGPGPADSGSAGADGGGERDVVLRVATFNAGLLDSVGQVSERAPLVNEALAGLAVDLLCVQEVWQEEHWDALVDANADTRPNVLRIDAMPGVQGDCSAEEFDPLRACSEQLCSGAGAGDLTSCTLAMCGAEVETLSSTCIACLLNNTDSGDFELIEAACRGTGSGGASGEPVPPEERSYLLGGSFGIGLLSKLPLIESDSLVLDSSGARRGILYAKVDAPELGELAVFCTHLTPRSTGTYDGSYDTWEGENEAHVKSLIDWVDEKTGEDASVIVLGDLNTGPALAARDIEPEVSESYAQLPMAGFADPFLAGPHAACTFCSENPLVIPTDTGVNATIDHVLTRGIAGDVSVDRILTGLHPAASDEDGGASADLPYSDHYGLEAHFFE